MRLPFVYIFLTLLASPPPSPAVTAEGVRTIDGDTIVAMVEGKKEHIRIFGINAPEKWEPLWRESRTLTASLTQGKKLEIVPKGRDRFGRLLAFVGADGKTVGLELVAQGLARVYSNQYAPDDIKTYKEYQNAQIGAMRESKGIWGEAVFVRGHR